MPKRTLFALFAVASMGVSAAQASNITNMWVSTSNVWGNPYDSDDLISTWGSGGQHPNSPNATINVVGGHDGVAAQMSWGLAVDDPDDPTLTLHNTVFNDGLFVWTAYYVTVTMNKAFTFGTISVLNPGDWGYSASAVNPIGGGLFEGLLTFSGPTPVLNDPTYAQEFNPAYNLEFSYQVSFSGSSSYKITEAVEAVPEPGTIGLLAIGSLLFGGLAMARRRK